MQFNILIIDDEKNIREGLADAMELEGYKAFVAEDGKAGLARIAKGDIDLVITDLRMPGVTGEQVLSKVTAENPGVPVIVLTGHGSIDAAVDAMGLATRLNSRCATKILVSFEKTKAFFSGEKAQKVVVSGNPVRPVFYEADPAKGLKFLGLESNGEAGAHEKPILLVLGGSLGAVQINNLIYDTIDWLCENYIVVHQTGKSDYERFSQLQSSHADYHPYAFIYGEMPDVMAAADIVLSRAGSNFLWECSVTGKPLVLIPLAGSGTRGDQVENARFFESQGAAKVLTGDDVNDDNLKKVLLEVKDVELRKKLSENVKAMSVNAKPALKIAELMFEQIKGRFA